MEIKTFLNLPIHQMVGNKKHEGNKFGIELELEGRGVGMADVATKGWTRHHDGSLRGESIEYTTSGPKTFDESKGLVEDLFSKFKKNGVKFNDSIRTSTHVHLNFSDKKVKQAVNFFAVFTLVEEVLQYYSGEDRKGNLFCISAREAEGIVGVLADAIGRCDLSRFAGDRYKYAACNLSTLYKFGTIEVRTMRGATSAEQVNNWLSILNDMYVYSLKMQSPADLITNLSVMGDERLMRDIFSPANYRELMGAFPPVKTLHYSLMEGARLLQVFAYQHDEAFKAEVVVPEVKVGALPVVIEEGPHMGCHYAIYRPDGREWNVIPERRLGIRFWEDGTRVGDCVSISWSERLKRFIYTRTNGDIIPCRWKRHHAMPNEGPPPPALRISTNTLENRNIALLDELGEAEEQEEEDVEIEFDEDHNEGDDF
jgi:hypothetical protein